MNSTNSRLASETNKLITQTLSKEGGIYLPSIGSLSFATITEEGEAINTILLSKEERHKSLIKIIEERGNCSNEQATMLYEKWVEEIKQEDGSYNLTSLGAIKGGEFIVEESLFNRLNVNSKRARKEVKAESIAAPIAEKKAEVKSEAKKVEVKSKAEPKPTPKPQKEESKAKGKAKVAKQKEKESSPMGWIVAAVVIVAAIVGLFIYGGEGLIHSDAIAKVEPTTKNEVKQDIIEEVAEVTEPEVETGIEAAVEVEEATEEVVEEVIEPKADEPTTMPEYESEPVAKIKSNDPIERLRATLTESTNPKKFRVVCGIFSSERNAGKMLIDIDRKLGEEATPKVYQREDKTYMVTLHEANNFRECADYINKTAVKHYKASWVYNDKSM